MVKRTKKAQLSSKLHLREEGVRRKTIVTCWPLAGYCRVTTTAPFPGAEKVMVQNLLWKHHHSGQTGCCAAERPSSYRALPRFALSRRVLFGCTLFKMVIGELCLRLKGALWEGSFKTGVSTPHLDLASVSYVVD